MPKCRVKSKENYSGDFFSFFQNVSKKNVFRGQLANRTTNEIAQNNKKTIFCIYKKISIKYF